MKKDRHRLILEPISKRVNVRDGSTVYEAILALNFPISAMCGGTGTCGKCLISVIDDHTELSEPSEREVKNLGKNKLSKGFRLACQAKVLGDSRVYLTKSLILKGNRILVYADLKFLRIENKSKINPLIVSQVYHIPFTDLNNPKNDLSCLLNAISQGRDEFGKLYDTKQFYVDDCIYNIVKKLPILMRENDRVLTVFFRRECKIKSDTVFENWKLFDINAGSEPNKIFGLAIDIGTTTIVGYLINLISGETASISAMLNPQVAIGEDLISRITYIIKKKAIDIAKNLVINAINEIIEDCCNKAGISINDVKDITVVGNTGMHHIFFGLPSDFLAVSPYVPVFKTSINISAGALGLKCNPNVNVYSPPVIAGYVGTDTIGGIISTRIDTYDKYSLLIDIGTNGELVMGNKYGLIACSCAAGSALEGAHITYGMRAAEGAIESVLINKETLEPTITIIGEIKPLGLCGSGLIDIVSELLKSNVITRAGKFNINLEKIKNNRRIVKKENDYCYIVYKSEWDDDYIQIETSEKGIDEITISQKDINQLQLAKGAFLSASYLLLESENKNQNDLEQIILAGGFGTYINKNNSAFIGLFPEVKSEEIFQIGNSAGIGAQLLLKDFKLRDLANQIAHKIKYFEIASSPSFQKEYAFSLYFPHYDLERFPSLKEEYEELKLS